MPDMSPPNPAELPIGTEATPMTPLEIIHVNTPVVACDGGDGALGHPRVWLRIVSHQIVCPYCSRSYVLNDGVAPDSAH